VSINLAPLVTVPVLDARVHELRSEIQALRQDFKLELAGETGKVTAELTKVHASIAQTHVALAEGLGSLRTEIQKVNAHLMRWVLLTSLGSAAISMVARSITNVLSN
jgi:hypothetical protein